MNIRFLFLLILSSNFVFCQKNDFNRYIETSDINKFWIAFDSIKGLKDENNKIHIFQKIYIDKASKGLQDFIISRNFTSEKWIKSFVDYPRFWSSIRPKTQDIYKDFEKIENIYKKFSNIYPEFNPPKIYFTIGNLKGGGTVINGNLIIGSELASSDNSIDYSELPKNYQDRIKLNTGILFLTVHELVHTQQNLSSSNNANLLGHSLKEGAADFIAELILNKQVEDPYINFGIKNQCKIWNEFKKDMYDYNFDNWLSNTTTIQDQPADLGYFIGYVITKSYYTNSKSKEQAIKEILSLNFEDKKSIQFFLKKSRYKCQ